MRSIACLTAAGFFTASIGAQTGWMPKNPGPAQIVRTFDRIELKNGAIQADFAVMPVGMRLLGYHSVWDPDSHANFSEAFAFTFRDGHMLPSSRMPMRGGFRLSAPGANGTVDASLVDPASGLEARWRAVLIGGTTFIREELTLTATKADVDLANITFGEARAPDYTPAKVMGNCLGSPVTSVNLFFGIESPMAVSKITQLGWVSRINRKVPLRKGQSVSYSAVLGVAPEGQMRRAFLAYLERVRPRPYHPFLHYNSWYDIGYFTRYKAEDCVDRINTFGRELVDARHVHLASFLFDDGWDDTSTIWKFNTGFPKGFTPITQAAERYGADPGIWLSPWGGYEGPREQRLKVGRAEGLEIDSEGFALSGPKYYAQFRETCLDLIRKYRINQFKFDGTGSPDKQYPGSAFDSDFDAAISLIHDLREARPGLFINLTTGTWPSPFWTRYADSIWRDGDDHSFAGVGPWREKWITYRDGQTFHGVVQQGPLFPLNSLMLHGIIYAKEAQNLKDDPSNDFANEVHDYFGTGTQLQELYITPSLLTKQNWDVLAEAARWSGENHDVLVDTHWVGGDPAKLQPYGWASWAPRAGILTLRNPSDHAQEIVIEPRKVFELPESVKGKWRAKSPFASDPRTLEISADRPHTFLLQPFEVRTFEGAIR